MLAQQIDLPVLVMASSVSHLSDVVNFPLKIRICKF